MLEVVVALTMGEFAVVVVAMGHLYHPRVLHIIPSAILNQFQHHQQILLKRNYRHHRDILPRFPKKMLMVGLFGGG
jgi:hypothetical protein